MSKNAFKMFNTCLTTVGFGLGAHSWLMALESRNKDQVKINTLETKVTNKEQELSALQETIKNLKFEGQLNDSTIQNLNLKIENLKNEVLNLNHNLATIKSEYSHNHSVLNKVLDEMSKDPNKFFKADGKPTEKLTDLINKSDGFKNGFSDEKKNFFISDDSSSNIIDSIKIFYKNLNEYFMSLNIIEISYLVNFIGLLIIIFNVWAIVITLYSDYIIKYFNIEEKYPKLAKFIKIRRIAGNFYIIFNILIILFISISLAYLNIRTFLNI